MVAISPIFYSLVRADIRLANAQVFHDALQTSTACIAAALDWLCEQHVAVVNMSFGLQHDRRVLRQACAQALTKGTILVAASPARGVAVYPAAYPGVLRVTRRCSLPTR